MTKNLDYKKDLSYFEDHFLKFESQTLSKIQIIENQVIAGKQLGMTQMQITNLRNRMWAHQSRIKEERNALFFKRHLKDKDDKRL